MNTRLSSVALTILTVWASALAGAAEPPTLVIEIKSLDALIQDMSKLRAGATPADAQQLLEPWLRQLGLSDVSWIDGSRPMVFVLPRSAASLGAWQSWIVAVPAKDPATPLAALDGASQKHTQQQDGLHAFERDGQPTLHVRAEGSYLLGGLDPAAVAAFDRKAALAPVETYEGNFVVDADLEVLGPLATMGLAMQQQALRQQLEDADPADSEGRPPAEGMEQLVELYTRALQAMLSNSSRLQLSLEMRGEHAVLHVGLKARPGTTLSGLLSAQPSEFPDLARLVADDSPMISYASNIRYTPEFRASMAEFTGGYFGLLQSLMGAANETLPYAKYVIGLQSGMAQRRIACSRGDSAGVIGFIPGEGFRLTQVAGLSKNCESLVEEEAATFNELVSTGVQPGLTASPSAVVHQGVTGLRIDIDPGSLLDRIEDEERDESQATLERVLGKGPWSTFMGRSRDVLLTTSGTGAEPKFKEVVDRLAGARPRGALRPDAFAPLEAKGGFWAVADLDKVFSLMKVAGAGQAMEATPTGRVVFGATAEIDRLHVALAIPLTLVTSFASAQPSAAEEKLSLPWPPPTEDPEEETAAVVEVAEAAIADVPAEALKSPLTLQRHTSDGIDPPVRAEAVEPAYPEDLRQQGLEARVFIRAVIRADGTTADFNVLRCNVSRSDEAPYTVDPEGPYCAGFTAAAIEALSHWRYEPARDEQGNVVAVYFTVVVDFTLK